MNTRKLLGVWLDRSKAVLVDVSSDKPNTSVLESGIETRLRIPGEGDQPGRFGRQFLANEQTKKARLLSSEKRFLGQVMKAVADGDQLVIYGPARMKLGLAELIRENTAPMPNIRDVITADSMTDNQVAALIRKYYGK